MQDALLSSVVLTLSGRTSVDINDSHNEIYHTESNEFLNLSMKVKNESSRVTEGESLDSNWQHPFRMELPADSVILPSLGKVSSD